MAIVADDREALGRLVHEIRLACESERAAAEGRQRFLLPPWEERDDWQRELDMRIGAEVAAAGAERAERAEAARLAVLEAALRRHTHAFTDPGGAVLCGGCLEPAPCPDAALAGKEPQP